MRYKLTFFLILANAVVFSVIYYLANEKLSDDSLQSSLLPPSFMAQINEISFSGSALKDTKLQKVDDGWNVVEPYEWQANPFSVQEVISILESVRQTASFAVANMDSGQSLKDYGLEVPLLKVELKTPKESRTLRFGQPSEGGTRFYMLSSDGKTIHVIGDDLAQSFNNAFTHLYNGRILPVAPAEVTSITTQDGLLRVRLNRTDSGWKFETPIQTNADATAVESALSFITNLTVVSFVPKETASMINTETSVFRLTLDTNGKQGSQSLIVLGNAPKDGNDDREIMFAMREGGKVVFTVDAAKIDVLKRLQTSLRDKHLFKMDAKSINYIAISSSGTSTILEKLENESWQTYDREDDVPALKKYVADPVVIQSVLGVLTKLKVDAFVSDAPTEELLDQYGFNEPLMTIVVGYGTQKMQLVVGNLDEMGNAYVKTGDAKKISSVYKVNLNDSFYGTFPMPLSSLNYRNRVMKSFPEKSELQSFTVADNQDSTIVFDSEESKTKKDLSKETQDAIKLLMGQLLNLRVSNYVDEGFDPDGFGYDEKTVPWSYRLTANVKTPDGVVQKMEFFFTKRMKGLFQIIGAYPEQDLVFVPDQKTADAIFQLTEKESESQLPAPVPADAVKETAIPAKSSESSGSTKQAIPGTISAKE